MRRTLCLLALMVLICSVFVGSASAALTMRITGEFPDGIVNKSYHSIRDVRCNMSPGSRWQVIDGTMPPGLGIQGGSDDRCLLSGTPTTEGSYTFTLRVTNGTRSADKTFTINIVYDPEYDKKPELTGEFPNGTVGKNYHSTLDVWCPWSFANAWEVIDGKIPPGLHLSYSGFGPSTDGGASAELRGTPTTAGTYTFTIRVTNIYHDNTPATKEFTIVISDNEPDDPNDDNKDDNNDNSNDDNKDDNNNNDSNDDSNNDSGNNNPTPTNNDGGGGGGGGCNAGAGSLGFALLILSLALPTSRKIHSL